MINDHHLEQGDGHAAVSMQNLTAIVEPKDRTVPDASTGLRGDRRGIEEWLVARIARAQGVDPEQIDVSESFVANGLNSASSVALVGALARTLGVTLPETLIWEYPSIGALAEYVAGIGPYPHEA